MERSIIFLIFFATIILAVILAKTIRVTLDDERLVVFRLGQFLRVSPPGKTTVIPFFDRAVNVKVEEIAGWRTLRKEELQERLVQIARQKLAI
jgi:regulator of protease activity HflC (stomatin/prohibitin superfamily)